MKDIISKGEALTIASMIEREIANACKVIGVEMAEALSSKIGHDMVVSAIDQFLCNGIDGMVEDAIIEAVTEAVDTYETQDKISELVTETVDELMPDTIGDLIEDAIGRAVDMAGIPDQIKRAIAELTDRMNYLDQEIEEVRGVAAAAEAARSSVVLPNGIRGRLRWLLTGR